MAGVNKTAQSEAQAYIEDIAPLWRDRMGLTHIEIEHHYLDASSDVILGASPGKSRPGLVRCGYNQSAGHTTYTAFVETRWNYQMADVYFMMPSVVQWSQERIEGVVVHEYSHILCASEQYLLEVKIEEIAAEEAMTTAELDAMARLFYERMEMATENVARAVLRSHSEGLKAKRTR